MIELHRDSLRHRLTTGCGFLTAVEFGRESPWS
jgi:hypothetical protein